uniref:transglycosylase domain-containing protein n=1 Tax=Roseovarius salinarum TaxID=1981892 RepID=UPI0018E4A359
MTASRTPRLRAGPIFAVALVLFSAALARDTLDRWVAATDLPVLVAETSTEVRDRDGTLLRVYTVADGLWRLPVAPEAVDPGYIDMLLAYEDKRFHDHAGVDPVALMRAAAQAVWHGRIVSGGSTLTMQVARLLEDGTTGTIAGKLRQMRVALALERRLSKRQILRLYLMHAPFGGNLEGVRAASLAWFDTPPARLTPAQAALLVALPQAPE